jgi:PAS domain S-box-containing protein
MAILPIVIGLAAGICIGTGVIYLFVGLRRQDDERLNLTFALFALSYAGANITAILEYKAISLEQFMRIGNWTALFTVMTLILLMWFVAVYTKVQPRVFLKLLTLVLILVGAVAIIRPNSVHTEIFGIVPVALPWGETINLLDASESLWEIVFFLSEIVLVGFAIYACMRQFLVGERQKAYALGLGLAFLLFALIFDIIFIDSGQINFVYLGDYGFLPLAVVMGIQLANQVLETEDELGEYRQNLEQMVDERTEELERSNVQLTQEITSRQQAEAALRQSERMARALLDAPSDSAMLVDLDGAILNLNEIAAARLGIDVRDSIGKNIYTLFDDTLAEKRRSKADQLIETKKPVTWEDERIGRSYENHLYPILDDDDQVASIAIFARDITQLKKIQEQEMVDAATQERTRLARDLHDAVTQTIYSASLIAEVLPTVWERDPQAGQRNLVKLRQLVRGALAEMRTLLFELRPASLEAAELSALLHQLGDSLTGRTRIPVAYQMVEDSPPPKDIKVAVYHIAQEAFNNIAKHSEATQIEVKLHSESDQVQLSVKDDGRGFDPMQVAKDKLGIQIMTERAREINASIKLNSSAGKGTQVSISWPGEESAASKIGEGKLNG